MFTSLPWKPFPALRVNGLDWFWNVKKGKNNNTFFHWSVCTLYMLYHHFMNFWRKMSPTLSRWELVSPSCGNSEAAMSGDTVISLGGVLSGGWDCVTTPDAGCFVIFLPDCYADVFMNGLETQKLDPNDWFSAKMKPQWRFPPSQRGRKAKCYTEVVAIWSLCVPLGLFFLSNTYTVLWLSGRNISIFRWC